MSSVRLLFVAVSILSCAAISWGRITCLDNDDKPVDWLVDMKWHWMLDKYSVVFFVQLLQKSRNFCFVWLNLHHCSLCRSCENVTFRTIQLLIMYVITKLTAPWLFFYSFNASELLQAVTKYVSQHRLTRMSIINIVRVYNIHSYSYHRSSTVCDYWVLQVLMLLAYNWNVMQINYRLACLQAVCQMM